MTKPKFETPDLTAENVTKISELFPGTVTEGKVNFDLLRSMFGDEVYGDEAYEFTWVGKRDAIAEAGRPIRKTLRPCIEESKNWETTENLYIEGDNLDVLKLLQESYLGKVKMIYIDPPYNTGNDFIYRDDFKQSREEYEDEAGVFDEDGDRLFRNTETNGRFHSDWCSMIYPRLVLARNMLRDDGVIFISIDFREFDSLKKICNEVFGEQNYVGEIIWQTATDNNPSQISMEHEYILCYARNLVSQGKWTVQSEKAERINQMYCKLRQQHGTNIEAVRKALKDWVKSNEGELKGATHYTYVDEKGVYYPGNSSNTKPGGYTFDIIHPITKKVCSKPEYGYRWTEKTFLDADKRGDVEWGETETTIPKIKKRIETVTEMLKSYYYEDNRYWTKYINNMLGSKVFENPKSVNLLRHLLRFITYDNDIILDFFSGSATTAHAVIQLNAEDGGKRKFIMVQLPETCAEGTEAAKAGYKNICEIGKERIRRAGEKIKVEAGDAAKALDIGFRVLKLADTNMNDIYYAPMEYTQDLLSQAESNIKPDRTDLDLLFGCLLDWGLPLSMSHTSEKVDDLTVHTYNDGDLIACFDESVSEKAIHEIASRKPLRAVFRDASFSSSPEKINVFEIFKILAPNTNVKVM